MTAPLGFLGTDDVAVGLGRRGATGRRPGSPLVHKPVGIFAKHAGVQR